MVSIRLLAAVALLGLVVPTAHAVVPSGSRVLSYLVETQPSPVPFAVNYVEASRGGDSKLAIRVVSDGQGRARLDLQFLDQDVTTTLLFRTAEASTSPGVERLDDAPLWLQWWMGRSGAEMAAGAHVDVTISSLAHVQGTVLWVLGAGPRQGDRPQLQIERETGLLRRAVTVRGHGEDAVVSPARLDGFIAQGEVVTRFPERLTLTIEGREVTFVNTWLRMGNAVHIAPGELRPPAPRPPDGRPAGR